jgi:hypothetical protein
MTRGNIWPLLPGVVLLWLLFLPSPKRCKSLVDSMCTERGNDQSEEKNLLDSITQMSVGQLLAIVSDKC